MRTERHGRLPAALLLAVIGGLAPARAWEAAEAVRERGRADGNGAPASSAPQDEAQPPAGPLGPRDAPPPAADDAQGGGGWLAGRFTVRVNGALRPGPRRLEDAFGYRAYGDRAEFRSAHEIGGGSLLDAGGSLRVWRNLALGAAYTQRNVSDAARLDGRAPHPIRPGAFRDAPPQALSFDHRERATHVFAAWRIPLAAGFEASLFGGPSYFHVTQGVVTNATLREAGGPPFAAVRFDRVQTGRHARNGLGGHAGLDLTYMPLRHVGVGLVVRWSSGVVRLPSARAGDGIELRAGGVEYGGGFRIRF